MDSDLVLLSDGQDKACWNYLSNKFFHKSLFFFEKSCQMVFKPCHNKSWFLFSVNNPFFSVFWQLFNLNIQRSIVFGEQTFLS